MKKILTFLFGNLGLLIMAVLMAVISWFMFPLFIQIVHGGHSLSNLIGWVIICPFAIGFLISAFTSALGLLIKGAKAKQWFWIVPGALLLVFDILILILNLI